MEVLVYSPSTGTEEVVGKGVRHWAYIKWEKAQNTKQACRTVTTMIRGLDSLVILNQYIMLRTMDCEEASPAFGVWVSKWTCKGRRRGLLATRMRVLDLAHMPSGGRPRVQQLGQSGGDVVTQGKMQERFFHPRISSVAPRMESPHCHLIQGSQT